MKGNPNLESLEGLEEFRIKPTIINGKGYYIFRLPIMQKRYNMGSMTLPIDKAKCVALETYFRRNLPKGFKFVKVCAFDLNHQYGVTVTYKEFRHTAKCLATDGLNCLKQMCDEAIQILKEMEVRKNKSKILEFFADKIKEGVTMATMHFPAFYNPDNLSYAEYAIAFTYKEKNQRMAWRGYKLYTKKNLNQLLRNVESYGFLK